jgi:hypothetical protein
MRNRDGALRWLWALGAGLLVFAVGALPAYRSYLHARDAIEREFYQMLLNTALAAATTVDPELHKTFRPGEETTEKYRRAIEPLAKIQATNPKIKFIYTFIRKDGKIYFVLDATPPGDHDHDGVEDKSYIGDEYPEATAQMHAVFDAGTPQITPIVTDRWGSFVSAYVPLRERTGTVIGALGVDITAADYLNTLGKAEAILHQNLLLAAGLAALVGWGVWLFLSYRARDCGGTAGAARPAGVHEPHPPADSGACAAAGVRVRRGGQPGTGRRRGDKTDATSSRESTPQPQPVRDDAQLPRDCRGFARRASGRSHLHFPHLGGTPLPHLLLARVRRRRQPRLAGGRRHR